jgi:hypothetical protein
MLFLKNINKKLFKNVLDNLINNNFNNKTISVGGPDFIKHVFHI